MTRRVIATTFALAVLLVQPAAAQFLGDALASAGVNMTEYQAAEALAAAGVMNNDPSLMTFSATAPTTGKVYSPAGLVPQPGVLPSDAAPNAPASQAPASTPQTDLGSVPSGGGSYGFSGAESHAAAIDQKAAAAWNDAFRPVGTTLTKLPGDAVAIEVGGASYSYSKGMFLKKKGDGWEVVPAPVGAAVAEKPVGAATVFAGGKPFLYYAGTFFIYDGSQKAYAVVAAPAGATVQYLPDTAKKLQRDGSVHYEYAGTYYKPFYRGTSVVYTVAG